MDNNADNNSITNCANCGKGEESSGDLKACVACKLVKYCNRECQIAHRPQHKKACKKRAAELHDEALFKEHPPTDDCPICFIPLPVHAVFKSCCGKRICEGCIFAMKIQAIGRGKMEYLCPFCREPTPSTGEERVERIKKCMEADNGGAFHQLAGCYATGDSMPQDLAKANELYLRGGELGCAESYYNLGIAYRIGSGAEVDKKKSKHFDELAAMGGSLAARHNLGCFELADGNHHRAHKHFLLAAKAGYKRSLDNVKIGYTSGVITKDEYANTMRAYQERVDEMKSEGRDRAEEFEKNCQEQRGL